MPEYKLFAQRVGLTGIVNIIVSLRGLILLPILTKTLGTDLYGVWTLILVTIYLLMPLGLLGLSTAMIRFFAGERDKNKIRQDFYAVFTLITLFSVLVASIFFAFSEPLAIAFFGGSSSITFVRLLSPIIIITTLDVICIEFFRAFQQMKKYAGLLILQQILEIIFISYAILSGYSLFGALLSLIVVRAFLLLLGFLIINSQIGIGRPNLNLSVLKPYLSFSLPLIPATISYLIVNLSDRYVIGYFLGVASVGIYSAAYNIGSIVGIFAVLSKSLLATLTTSEFLSAYLIVPIVALAVILFNCRSVFFDVLTLLKRTKIIGLIYGIAALLNLILNIILVPVIGILGAAISTLLTFFIFAVIVGILSFTEIPFEIDVKFILKSVIASVPMAFVVWKLNPYGAVDIVIAVGIAAVIYFGVLILLRGFTKDEYGFLRDFVKSVI